MWSESSGGVLYRDTFNRVIHIFPLYMVGNRCLGLKKVTLDYYDILKKQCNNNHTKTSFSPSSSSSPSICVCILVFMDKLNGLCHIQEKHFASINHWRLCDGNRVVWRRSFGHEIDPWRVMEVGEESSEMAQTRGIQTPISWEVTWGVILGIFYQSLASAI